MVDITILTEKADELAKQSAELSQQTKALQEQLLTHGAVDPFVFGITVFVLACFVGYYVVWRVTPALHTPLMSVTNAISGIIIVGAIVALGPEGFGISHILGFLAVVLASVNIFGGFMVTQRMLEMFKKKEKPKHTT